MKTREPLDADASVVKMAIGANATIAVTKMAACRMSLMVSFFPARQRLWYLPAEGAG